MKPAKFESYQFFSGGVGLGLWVLFWLCVCPLVYAHEDPYVTALIHRCSEGLTSNWDDVLTAARGGEIGAKERLFLRHIKIYLNLARPYRLEQAEAVSIAYLGFHHALTKWSPDKKTSFSSYSVFWVRAALSSSYRGDSLIRLPAQVHDWISEAKRMASRIELEEGRPAELNEVLSRMELKPKKREALKKAFNLKYPRLDPLESDDPLDLILSLGEPADVVVADKEIQDKLDACSKQLDKRMKHILYGRFALNQSLSEMASDMGLVKQTVLNLQNKALKHIKTCMKRAGVEID